LEGQSNYNSVISVTYYTLTTLATVGYGDLHPKSDLERMVASAIMLIGVVVFSFIMSNFTEIVLTWKAAYLENGDPGSLVQWFKVL
jgi:hypothetical protein